MSNRTIASIFAVAGILAALLPAMSQVAQLKSKTKVSDLIKADAAARPKPKGVKEVSTEATDEGLVEWGFLRTQRPALVDFAMSRYGSGESEFQAVSGLASNGALKDYASGTNKGSKVSTPPPSSGLPRGILTRPNNTVARSLFALPLEISPKSVDFGSLVNGQWVRRVVYIRNVPAGVGKAAINGESPFRIVEMKVMDGRVRMTPSKEWAGSLVGTGAAERSSLNEATTAKSKITLPTALMRPRGGFSESAVAKSPSAVIAAMNKRTVATEAPFEVDTAAGHTLRVLLEYRPHFDLFSGDPVGRHRSNLELEVGGRVATVPLNAWFDGVNIGVVTLPESREFTLLCSLKMEKHPSGGNMVVQNQHLSLSIPITFLNPKEACEVGISGFDLPEGVTLKGSGVFKVPNGESKDDLTLDIHFRGDGYSGASHGMGQEMVFKVYYPGGVRYFSVSLNLLPEMRFFSARGRVDDVNYDIGLTAKPDGVMDIDYEFKTSNYWPTDAEFKFYIDGVFHAHVKWISLRDSNGRKVKVSAHYHSPALEQDWNRFVQAPGSFWIKVSEHL